jgi:hypothetical protein
MEPTRILVVSSMRVPSIVNLLKYELGDAEGARKVGGKDGRGGKTQAMSHGRDAILSQRHARHDSALYESLLSRFIDRRTWPN